MQVKIAVLPPILRLAVIVFADTSEFSDVDAPNTVFDASLNDVCRQGVEKVGSTLRPLRMESSGFFTTRVVTLGNFLREVVAILFQPVAGVEVGFLGAVRDSDSGEVTDTEVNTRCLGAGCVGSFDFVLADEVKFPPLFGLVVDCSDLL
ncbi:MAG: hypothetical protein J07HQW1_02720 [Haloquadratum walsbyi J07HQW1]|uniref:Uncharacterized protein n=1 Tax=Haloquadratum walsbyi J07HQW1 TaxID=1238424 RepID=U1N7J7_9EURY|nr:MAG: hypothetical protein J07HQW1_02720 [Haloquadratum walsbyi J07HQW1]